MPGVCRDEADAGGDEADAGGTSGDERGRIGPHGDKDAATANPQAQDAGMSDLKAPFPWFGGKSRVADIVWDRFGDVDNYVEPFAGSLAVLLGRPTPPQTETINDLDCYLANFWRALQSSPGELALRADWPVNEADLHARHQWLVNQAEFRERMKTDPDFCDVKIAAWWVWGISQWIGSGWCSHPEWSGRTNAGRVGRGIHRKRPMVAADNEGKGVRRKLASLGDKGRGTHREVLGNTGMGVNRQLPHLGDAGRGGESATAAPGLSGRGSGIGIHSDERSAGLLEYFHALAARLRRVRVCCGDWARVTGPSATVKHGVCGVFLDPPYDMRVVSNAESGRDGAAPTDALYNHHDNDVSGAVRKWAIENANNPLLRIALCGYEGEHEMPGEWECVPWKAHGGYGAQRGGRGNQNAGRERIWFSPHCLRTMSLFASQDSLAEVSA
ncbi:MAG TPA: DNA adenine methylase [Bryobacteraceae bacterium]|nr:DNA adenine methylase [Bryobacteraceae bacterium]